MDKNLVTYTAILGHVSLAPVPQLVKVGEPQTECIVAANYCSNISIEDVPDETPIPNADASAHTIFHVDVSDCTIFKVIHKGLGGVDLKLREKQTDVFERSLLAISEVIIWMKTKEKVGTLSSFARQVGRPDVKVFLVDGDRGARAVWKNPNYMLDSQSMSIVANLFSNVIMQNGPAANPTSQLVRRVMSFLDLINLGFYTESFITSFSLCDDLVQNIVKAGLSNKGLSGSQQKEMLRAIKEERLRLYLTNLMKLIGWKSLEEDDSELFNKLMKINTLRNKIMHGDKRINRDEAVSSTNTVLSVIKWLRSNPFGYTIDTFPLIEIPDPN